MKYSYALSIPCIIVALALVEAQAQVNTDTYYVRVQKGEKTPDYTMTPLLNYPNSSAKISDFRGKLLLLDFWNNGCLGCIKSWPKLTALQQKFGKDIQFILVNTQNNEKEIRDFLDRRKRVGLPGTTLPIVCSDSVLNRELFKISATPQIAWIDSGGTFLSLTENDQLTEQNIEAIIHHRNVVLEEVKQMLTLDYTKPLFPNNNGGSGEGIVLQSILSREIDGEGGFVTSIKDGKGIIYAFNTSIRDLYRMAFANDSINPCHSQFADATRVILEVADSNKYSYFSGGHVNHENLYTYHLTSPATDMAQLNKSMKEDLSRYFGLNAKIERRKMKCLVLSCDDTTAIAARPGPLLYRVSETEFKVNKVFLSVIVCGLISVSNSYPYLQYPIQDETGYKGEVGGIDIEGPIYSHKALDKALQRYKMHFTVQQRVIPVLVLRERGFPAKEKPPSN